MKDIAEKIREVVRTAQPVLMAVSPDSAGVKPAPGTWSKKEIIGHLIDSAANNHQRFVRAMAAEAASFPAYDQNAWVSLQRYNELPWRRLVEFWAAYNEHLAEVIVRVPKENLDNPCSIGKDAPVTLEFVIRDYLRHLRHHVGSVIAS
jgi:hypothetical protein